MIKTLLKATAVFFSMSAVALADYPEKPIRIIAPFAAGGSVDIVARLVSDPLAKALGQPVVVENKSGASGMIGTRQVADSNPDGYTLLANSSIHVIVPHLYKDVGYDALEDVVPVSQITVVPLVLLASPSMPFKTVPELLKWAKELPEGLSYASAGNGSTPHLAGEMLGDVADIDVVHVPYKGSGAAMVDVMGGQVPIMFDALTAVMGPIKGGKLVPLAVASQERSPLLPDVPTFAELGYPQFDMSTWHGIWAPKGTPKEVVDKLSTELQRISHEPNVEERIMSLGGAAVGNTPEEFDAFERSEYKKWGDLIERFDVKIE